MGDLTTNEILVSKFDYVYGFRRHREKRPWERSLGFKKGGNLGGDRHNVCLWPLLSAKVNGGRRPILARTSTSRSTRETARETAELAFVPRKRGPLQPRQELRTS